MNIVVIGFGWVGQANALSLSLLGQKVAFFDPGEPKFHYKDTYGGVYDSLERLQFPLERDSEDTCYIVSVGDKVLPNGDQDITNIKKALTSLSGARGTVVLRSTIIPMHLKDLRFDFYVPEFLHEKKAVEECMNPHYFVVGRNTEKPEPDFFRLWERRAYRVFRGTPEEGSYIKYLSNTWNSMRIAFVNEFGDAMRTPNTFADVRAIERVVDFVFEGKFYLRYGKAFGGHCLPKDTLAFYKAHKDKGLEMSLLNGVYASNEIHRKVQEQGSVLPEWYSQWQPAEISGKVALRSLRKAGGRIFVKIIVVPIFVIMQKLTRKRKKEIV